MPRYASLAEQYRAHRAAMELALATGCTPKEAEIELRRRAKFRRDACGRHAPQPAADSADDFEPLDRAPGEFGQWDARWMMRD